jgi:transketolase
MGNTLNTNGISKAALSVRALAMDAVEKAKSGHPGMPMGCAELGVCMYGEILVHFPGAPTWINRDRFVLSAGHGSMLLYSLLYLSGYDLTIDDIRNFRQLGSRTPGHPEHGVTSGVETSTGPLGQGISNAVGMAVAERMLGALFNTAEHAIVDHYTYALASDGDLMEGIASESASIAGHLGLGKLVVFYDSNNITIDGPATLSFSENVRLRFEGFGWHVLECDAYDPGSIVGAATAARAESSKPSLVIARSTIAKGAATMEGSNKSHGAPLGEAEILATRKKLGIPEGESFYVDPEAKAYFASRLSVLNERYEEWNRKFDAWSEKNHELHALWNKYFSAVDLSGADMPVFHVGDKVATRVAGGKVLNEIAKAVPSLVGGSADLASSNNTRLTDLGDFSRSNPNGRNINFGIREHAMGGISNGIALHGGLRPFCATFLIFSDYMKPSIRLASLMKLPVIYVFTHDSIFVGEDGPTHQPIEQLTALRIIPGMTVLRPADAEETVAAWKIAVGKTDGPVAILLSRQNLEVFAKPAGFADGMRKGAYVADDSAGIPSIVVVASGSEVSLGREAKAKTGRTDIRIVSVPSLELFLAQDAAYRESIVPKSAKKLFIEAGITHSWGNIGSSGDEYIGIDRFGESGPGQKVANHLGLDVETVVRALDRLSSR